MKETDVRALLDDVGMVITDELIEETVGYLEDRDGNIRFVDIVELLTLNDH